jgi:hypothetical protein
VIVLSVWLVVILLLNRRDRRRAALAEATWRLAPRPLASLIAIQVRRDLWGRRTVVEVDMYACTPDDVRGATARWRAGLPAGTRVRVNGHLDSGGAPTYATPTFTLPGGARP